MRTEANVYRCNVCGVCSEARQPRILHVIHREVPYSVLTVHHGRKSGMRKEIARELPVCKSCKTQLDRGVPLHVLRDGYEEIVDIRLPTRTQPVYNGSMSTMPSEKKETKYKVFDPFDF